MTIVHLLGGANLPRDPDSTSTSGITRVVLEIGREQVASGHRATILVVGKERWRSNWKGVELISIRQFPVGVFRFKGKTIDLRDHLAVALFCARRRAVVVHGHSYSYMRFINAPCRVVHFHSDPYFRGAPNEGLDLKAEDFALLAKYSDAQIGVSEFVAGELRKGMTGPGNVHAIPNGIDPDRFRNDDVQASGREYRRELGIPANAFVVLFAGSITPEKGFIHLARSFARLNAQLPNTFLMVAGSTGLWGRGFIPEYRKQYEADARLTLANVGDHVRFLGAVPSAEMPRVYAASEVITVPSMWREGFGLVALEALASGIPVVASRTGGLVEIVNESCGRLVEPGSEGEILAALHELAVDDELRYELGRFGIEIARQYTWQSTNRQLKSLYNSVR